MSGCQKIINIHNDRTDSCLNLLFLVGTSDMVDPAEPKRRWLKGLASGAVGVAGYGLAPCPPVGRGAPVFDAAYVRYTERADITRRELSFTSGDQKGSGLWVENSTGSRPCVHLADTNARRNAHTRPLRPHGDTNSLSNQRRRLFGSNWRPLIGFAPLQWKDLSVNSSNPISTLACPSRAALSVFFFFHKFFLVGGGG